RIEALAPSASPRTRAVENYAAPAARLPNTDKSAGMRAHDSASDPRRNGGRLPMRPSVAAAILVGSNPSCKGIRDGHRHDRSKTRAQRSQGRPRPGGEEAWFLASR